MSGNSAAAIDASRLWKAVFDHDPAQLGAGMNLAVVDCAMGERAASLATLDPLLEFSPDSSKRRRLPGKFAPVVRNAALPEPSPPQRHPASQQKRGEDHSTAFGMLCLNQFRVLKLL